MNPFETGLEPRPTLADARPDHVGGRRPRRMRTLGPAIGALLLAIVLPWGLAQAPVEAAADPVAEAAAEGAGAETNADLAGDEVRVTEVPAAASFGVAFGFPAYRTAGAIASVQAGAVGAAAHVAWGTAGLAVGLQARAYPPVPWPVPTYLAAGADFYAGRITPHVAVGAHVPIAERWRLDLEGGVAWTPLLDARQMVPYASAGVSYALAVGLAPSSSTAPADAAPDGRPAVGRCVAGDPDPAQLDAAIDATVRRFVADATATYGSVYRDLRYRVRVVERDVDGALATVVVAYDGSVVERLTGRVLEASGTAEVDFRWGGCAWVRRALRY
ncbi:MAG: hypothetical protein P1P87_04600 [Trueperaceae bacterium]|nr:hypothetical protein [Trueperaceae bacterium]